MARTFNEYEEMIAQRRKTLIARYGGEEAASFYIANDAQINDYYNALDALAKNDNIPLPRSPATHVAMRTAHRWYDNNGVIHVAA